MIVKHYTLALNSQVRVISFNLFLIVMEMLTVQRAPEMLNQMQMIRNIFKRETGFGLLFAKLTVLGSLASGKACGCRAACRRWEIAPRCPVPL